MLRTVIILYFVCFSAYILFSRQPYYFDSEQTPGTVVEAVALSDSIQRANQVVTGDYPIVQFAVGSETFYYNGTHNYFQHYWIKPTGKIEVIYDPGDPKKADILGFFGYWVNMDELVFTFVVFVVLLGVAIAITGKHKESPSIDPDIERQMKYN